MRKRGAWRRRGFVIVAVALAFAVFAPALALPAGAAGPTTTAYGGATKPKRALTSAAAAKLRRALAAKSQATKRPAAKRQVTKRPAATSQAAKQAALERRAAAAALAAKRAAKKNKKKSSLSLPTLALLAVLPFLLIGIYLLASDYWRRRVPRKRNASLVITRVRDR